MGRLIELYRNFEIRWVRWGEEGAYHVISPSGTPVKEVGLIDTTLTESGQLALIALSGYL